MAYFSFLPQSRCVGLICKEKYSSSVLASFPCGFCCRSGEHQETHPAVIPMPVGKSKGSVLAVDQVQVEHRFCGFESHLDSRVRSKIACSYPAMESGARSNPYHNSVLKERKITSTEEKISFPLGQKGNSFPCHCPMHPGMD